MTRYFIITAICFETCNNCYTLSIFILHYITVKYDTIYLTVFTDFLMEQCHPKIGSVDLTTLAFSCVRPLQKETYRGNNTAHNIKVLL